MDIHSKLEEAQQEIRRLKNLLRQKDTIEKKLLETEERYRLLFENAADIILISSASSLKILDFNDKAVQEFGFSRKELENMRLPDLDVKEDSNDIKNHFKNIVDKGEDTFETVLNIKDGLARHYWVNIRAIFINGRYCIQSIARDITAIKKKEAALTKLSDSLIEMNTAMKLLLDQDNDGEESTSIQANIEKFILPFLGELNTNALNGRQKNLLSFIEKNLKEITSKFAIRLSSSDYGFTSRETEVAAMVKEGLRSKEIADILCISEHAIAFHRQSIRKKLGLHNKGDRLEDVLRQQF